MFLFCSRFSFNRTIQIAWNFFFQDCKPFGHSRSCYEYEWFECQIDKDAVIYIVIRVTVCSPPTVSIVLNNSRKILPQIFDMQSEYFPKHGIGYFGKFVLKNIHVFFALKQVEDECFGENEWIRHCHDFKKNGLLDSPMYYPYSERNEYGFSSVNSISERISFLCVQHSFK